VFERGHGSLGGTAFESNLTADNIRGIGNNPPYNAEFITSFATAPSVQLATLAGMDGGDGGWAVTYGEPTTSNTINLAIDEDQLSNNERNHTTEQVGYVVFENALVYP